LVYALAFYVKYRRYDKLNLADDTEIGTNDELLEKKNGEVVAKANHDTDNVSHKSDATSNNE
jgi:hypothetical protein